MPTLLELFRTQNLTSGVTAEVAYDVRDSKDIPVTSSNPFIQQTGVRALNFTRDRFSDRLTETLLEQELTGVRVLRAASEPILYGTEIVRISTRTTNILDDMKASTGGTGSDGLIGGLINRVEKVGTKVLSKLGITFPQLLIPTRIALNDKFKAGLEPNTPVTLAEIKKDGAGSLVGRFLAQNINGTPSQIGRSLTNSVIKGAKNSVRKLLFGTRKEGGQNMAEKNDAIFQLFDSKTTYSSYVDEQNPEILGRKDLSSYMEAAIIAAERVAKIPLRRTPETYSQNLGWFEEDEIGRNDLSSELALRQQSIDDGNFGGSIYEDKGNLPGSMPVAKVGNDLIKVPTFPSKARSNKYFWRENGNGSRYSELHKVVRQPGQTVAEPGLIAAYEQGLQYPYQDFGKAILPEQLYRNRALKDGTTLAGPNSTITSNAYGINNGSDAVNLTRVGNQTPADFVILKLGNIQFRATITGLNETFSPSWDSNKFIGNPFNYYTYSGIERSLSFNFKVFSLSCEEHNNAWEKLETLATKVYPFGRLAYGVKPPIINFTMSDLFKSRTVFIESLSYTTDDNTPWTISDGMTAPQIIDVAITLKFIEVNGAEGNIYDLARDLNCKIMPKTPAQQIMQKAGTQDQSIITDAEPSPDGGGTSTPIANSDGSTGNTPSINEGSGNSTTPTTSGGGTPTNTPVNIQPIDSTGIEEIDTDGLDGGFTPIPSTTSTTSTTTTTSGTPSTTGLGNTTPSTTPTTSGNSTQSTTNVPSKRLKRIPLSTHKRGPQKTFDDTPTPAPTPTPTVVSPANVPSKDLAPLPQVESNLGGIQPQPNFEIPKPIEGSSDMSVNDNVDINPNPSLQPIDNDEQFTPIPKKDRSTSSSTVVKPKEKPISNIGTNYQRNQGMTPPNPTVSTPQNTNVSTVDEAPDINTSNAVDYYETRVRPNTHIYESKDGVGMWPLNASGDDREVRSKKWKRKNKTSDPYRNVGGQTSELKPFVEQASSTGDITDIRYSEDRSVMYVDFFGGTSVEISNLEGFIPGSVTNPNIIPNKDYPNIVGNQKSDAFIFVTTNPGVKKFLKMRDAARKAYRNGEAPGTFGLSYKAGI